MTLDIHFTFSLGPTKAKIRLLYYYVSNGVREVNQMEKTFEGEFYLHRAVKQASIFV